MPDQDGQVPLNRDPESPAGILERLAAVEGKVEFIYQHIARQAAERLIPTLQAQAEKQVLAQLLEGAGNHGRNSSGDDQAEG